MTRPECHAERPDAAEQPLSALPEASAREAPLLVLETRAKTDIHVHYRPHPCPAEREVVYAALLGLPSSALAQLDDGFGVLQLPGALLALPEWSEMERRFGRRAMLVWVSVIAGWVRRARLRDRGEEGDA